MSAPVERVACGATKQREVRGVERPLRCNRPKGHDGAHQESCSTGMVAWPNGGCPECGLVEGIVQYRITTAAGYSEYYDSEQRLHLHDPNKTSTTIVCPNNHRWVRESWRTCRACGWTSANRASRNDGGEM